MRPAVTAMLGFLVVLTGCEPSETDRVAIQRWLLCDECSDGELDSVVAAGRRRGVVRALGRALEGPPESGRKNIQLQSQAMYQRIPSPMVAEADFVQHFVGNYVATYQSRAAIALGEIPTSGARAVLLEAVRNDSAFRDDVKGYLGSSAKLMVGAVDSSPQSAPADSLVRNAPAVIVRDVSNPDSLPVEDIRVVFQVESGGGRVSDSVQRTGDSGSATVRWQLGPGVDSLNVLRVVAAGQTVRFRATGRVPDLRVVFAVQPSNTPRGEAIAPPVVIAIVDPWDQAASNYNGTAVLNVIGAGISVADTVIGGVATFSDLRFGAPGTGFRLLARAGGATEAVSAPFDILP